MNGKEITALNDVMNYDDLSLEDDLLAAHESVTKLWVASKKDESKIETRFANLLISVLILGKKLGIEDWDEILKKRMEELKNN